MKAAYCHGCRRNFDSKSIAHHRKKRHQLRGESVRITFPTGRVAEFPALESLDGPARSYDRDGLLKLIRRLVAVHSYAEIADKLNDRGLKTPYGKHWNGPQLAKWAARNGVQHPTGAEVLRLTEEQLQRATTLIDEGMPATWVAEDLGLPNRHAINKRFQDRPGREVSRKEWERVWFRIMNSPILLDLHQQFTPREGDKWGPRTSSMPSEASFDGVMELKAS